MGGLDANEGIIIVAATNRPDVLDPALLRPGRFDRQIVVPRPDSDGREKILLVHMKKLPLAPDVNARVIAGGTPRFSGADLANLVNEAAQIASAQCRESVCQYVETMVGAGSFTKSTAQTQQHTGHAETHTESQN